MCVKDMSCLPRSHPGCAVLFLLNHTGPAEVRREGLCVYMCVRICVCVSLCVCVYVRELQVMFA